MTNRSKLSEFKLHYEHVDDTRLVSLIDGVWVKLKARWKRGGRR